jgi:hypothetical protein
LGTLKEFKVLPLRVNVVVEPVTLVAPESVAVKVLLPALKAVKVVLGLATPLEKVTEVGG